MLHRQVAFDIAKRDAIRIFCERLVEWLDRQCYSTDPTESNVEYRKGWTDAIRHVQRHLLR